MSDAQRTLVEIRYEMADLVTNSSGDPEAAHGRADELLIEALRKMTSLVGGDQTLWPREVEDLIESYESVEKWYA